MISFSEALDIVTSSVNRIQPEETVPLVLALDRVLARDVVASENIPAADNSAMDGYAVRAEDVTGASVETPVELRVVGESAAGSMFVGTLARGEAVRIMTGAVVPDGANAVVEVESTSEADGILSVRRSVGLGGAIRRAGEDLRAGSVAISEGKTVTPGDVGVLASLGVTNVPVRVPPKVGILSTGNELVEAHETPPPGGLRNSSLPALYAMCHRAGAEPIDLGIAGDDRDELEEALEHGLRYDILVTTGGVSAGAYDLVQHILPELGMQARFHKVNIKPGKPVLFGIYDEGPNQTLVFGLPGNPVSSLVTFAQFVTPAIRLLMRAVDPLLGLRARIDTPIIKTDGKRHFVRGILRPGDDQAPAVSTTGSQSSGAMSSMSRANCLIVVPENVERIESGQMVEIELL